VESRQIASDFKLFPLWNHWDNSSQKTNAPAFTGERLQHLTLTSRVDTIAAYFAFFIALYAELGVKAARGQSIGSG
jgi:hypothetical protein